MQDPNESVTVSGLVDGSPSEKEKYVLNTPVVEEKDIAGGLGKKCEIISTMSIGDNGIIDLTNDDLEIESNVRFSSKKKNKRKKDKVKKKAKLKCDATADKVEVSSTLGKGDDSGNIVFEMKDNVLGDYFIVENPEYHSSSSSDENIASEDKSLPWRTWIPTPSASTRAPSTRKKKNVNYNEDVLLMNSKDYSKLYVCQYCEACFEAPEDVVKHTEVHENKMDVFKPCDYSCNQCDRSFHTKSGLVTHRRFAHKIAHLCKSSDALSSHIKREKNTKRDEILNCMYKPKNDLQENQGRCVCEHCGKSFTAELYLERHRKIHTHGIMYGCDQCGKAFAIKRSLDEHMHSHESDVSDSTPFQCSEPGCDKKFTNLRAFKFHLKTHNLKDKPFPCPKCDRHFSEWGNMVRHMKIHLNIKEFECPDCDRKFSDKTGLTSHIRHIHTGEKPYKCMQCPKAFATKSDLNRHILKHSGERKFQCLDCGKRFKQHNSLVIHIRRKKGEKSWQCGVCSKRFVAKGALKGHMLTHSKLKLYECESCQKQFSHRGSLLMHMHSHTGALPFSCRICGQKFSNSSNRTRHEKTVHVHD